MTSDEKWPRGKIPPKETPICLVFPNTEARKKHRITNYIKFLLYDSDDLDAEYWLLQGRTIEARVAEKPDIRKATK